MGLGFDWDGDGKIDKKMGVNEPLYYYLHRKTF